MLLCLECGGGDLLLSLWNLTTFFGATPEAWSTGALRRVIPSPGYLQAAPGGGGFQIHDGAEGVGGGGDVDPNPGVAAREAVAFGLATVVGELSGQCIQWHTDNANNVAVLQKKYGSAPILFKSGWEMVVAAIRLQFLLQWCTSARECGGARPAIGRGYRVKHLQLNYNQVIRGEAGWIKSMWLLYGNARREW
ncbi:hypothetical protein BC829DRAFT_420564 [Chytridium lagenaria]|nr:hypothetical protein BC829DRAFT_420564 [Chytridium lagenaria]